GLILQAPPPRARYDRRGCAMWLCFGTRTPIAGVAVIAFAFAGVIAPPQIAFEIWFWRWAWILGGRRLWSSSPAIRTPILRMPMPPLRFRIRSLLVLVLISGILIAGERLRRRRAVYQLRSQTYAAQEADPRITIVAIQSDIAALERGAAKLRDRVGDASREDTP